MRTRRAGAAVALAFAALLASTGVAHAVATGEGGVEINHAAELCIELLEAGGSIDDCQEAPNPILPEINELIWGAISFVALLLLLSKFAFPALRTSMQARSDKISDSLEEAERVRTEAAGVLAGYQRQLAEAKEESGRIIDEARQSADSVKADLLARAETEAEEQRRRNAEQIAAEKDRVMSELQSQVAVLAIEMAERVVESNLDREASMRLIENYINDVGNGSNGATAGADARAGSAAGGGTPEPAGPRGPDGGVGGPA